MTAVIKPNKSGSSFGIEIIKSNKQFKIFLNNIENYKKIIDEHETIIFEKYIQGKELTVSVLSQNNNILPYLDYTLFVLYQFLIY